MDDTIFALASATGRAGIAVVRVSGPLAGPVLLAMGRRAQLPAPRRMTRVDLVRPDDAAVLDRALAAWFPGPRSFTGEDVLELHLHGGRAVLAAVVDVLAGWPGLRAAEPGEFTRRAFEHGKLDLTEAEGLADLVNAETEGQRRQALRQFDGGLSRLYEAWRGSLIHALAHLEADIDFPDEDLPEGTGDAVRPEIDRLLAEVRAHLQDDRRGERLREGLSVVIVGPPNVGKSSLLNILARRDAAIVAATAGTTRDVIEVHMDLGGFPVVVADTAGLRDATDPVEAEGIRRARRRAEDADLRIVMADARDWPELPPESQALLGPDTMVVVNKVDLRTSPLVSGSGALGISATTGEGVEALVTALAQAVRLRMDLSSSPVLTRARHRAALMDCSAALERYLEGETSELKAEDIRLAARALGRITGRVDVEDILDVVFRDFCIGK